MKFLCVTCDEAMALIEARGPEDGSMAVIFGCPSCGNEIAMLTNQMETQMVRSLGVKIGGRTAPAEAMETVRHGLSYQRGDPFSSGGGEEPQAADDRASTGSRCPFTGVVIAAGERTAHAAGSPVWTREAEARIGRVPSFAQEMVRKSVERHAREKGYKEINGAVLDEVRGSFGI